MKVYCVFVMLSLAGVSFAAPGSSGSETQASDDGKIELFSGVALEKNAAGTDVLNVRFQPGELRDAARTFEEARGKIKKFAPLLAGLGLKVIAVIGLMFGGLALLVTKALVVAKLAFFVASALGLQKLISGGGLSSLGGGGSQASPSAGWSSSPSWSAPASSSYPYARSSNVPEGSASDVAYKAQNPL